MTRRQPKPLAPPSDVERCIAGEAARAFRAAIADPSTMGKRAVMHVDLARPRRGEWWESWANLRGFWRINSRKGRYLYNSLPGWTYARAEIQTEMIPDLEAPAKRGERPTEATSGAAA